ncbi:Protein of unknown function DUF2065 [Pseudoxanthomonas suwonensis 11-1]|uniref:DUF2065 domain-containing protein n=1 Tax=Pseudoxanthomonas suwonensis (strain 11-1) TaxID=743721 RepID=E6WQY9_PSEUU|nr:DUF2065 domain-containing protein [Pseudoxanthomonas suwonensis]ADV26661.1 Protein of unknown function DUF2065 [Pseudoxanthomonas suwonensis 11-1]
MPQELVSALCLVAVLEGLLLFAAPRVWRQTMEQLLQRPDQALRRFGLVVLGLGLAALWLVRQG